MNRHRLSPFALVALLVALPVQADHELDGHDISAGARVYQQNCAVCHGANLEGQPDWRSRNALGQLPAPPHDETGHTWHHDNQYLFYYTKFGGAAVMAARGITDMTSGMPSFANTLSDDEILSVLAFIRSTWPDDIKAIQAERNPPHS